MKNIASRTLVFAAALALSSTVNMAFGQTLMTAEIPFAFHTAGGNLPAGTYQLETMTKSLSRMILVRNVKTQQSAFAGAPVLDSFSQTPDAPAADFVCRDGDCTLKAIRTAAGTFQYSVPKSKRPEQQLAVVEVPLKARLAD